MKTEEPGFNTGLAQVLADWSPARLRELVGDGDPTFPQHVELLAARTAAKGSSKKPAQVFKPKVCCTSCKDHCTNNLPKGASSPADMGDQVLLLNLGPVTDAAETENTDMSTAASLPRPASLAPHNCR